MSERSVAGSDGVCMSRNGMYHNRTARALTCNCNCTAALGCPGEDASAKGRCQRLLNQIDPRGDTQGAGACCLPSGRPQVVHWYEGSDDKQGSDAIWIHAPIMMFQVDNMQQGSQHAAMRCTHNHCWVVPATPGVDSQQFNVQFC
jgi:hypothetical protein